jgi:aspartate ammonia-lyase
MTPNKSIHTEHDLLCDLEIPAQDYYGVHTLRVLHNFPIAVTPISSRRMGGTHRLLR